MKNPGNHDKSMNTLTIIFIGVAAVSPFLFASYLLSGHGAFEDVFNYSPSTMKLFILLGSGLAVMVSAFIDHRLKRYNSDSILTIIFAILSLLIVFYFSYSIILPKYIRHGQAPTFNFIQNDTKIKPIHFAAGGDAHIGNPLSRTDFTLNILKLIGNDKYSIFFFLGDLADHGFDDSMWKRAMNDIDDFNNTIPIWFIPGNHDTMFGGEDLFKNYVLPDQNDTLWKRIDRGNIHFIILDVEWETQTYTRAQEKWLIDQLSSIPRKDWCIVMSHTFYYCSGKRKDGWNWFDNQKTISRLVPQFEKYGVDLVMSGHMHQTEVLKNQGVTYVVVGSLGGNLDSGREYVSPAGVWYKQGLYGFADVSINGNTGSLSIRDQDNKVQYRTSLTSE
jgi:UDP-2,3-diacylglucosamine pyrophosphatase LpxH